MNINIKFKVSWVNIIVVLILTFIFLGLKISGLIDWSWWWVFSPLWIDLLLMVGIFLLMIIAIPFIKSKL